MWKRLVPQGFKVLHPVGVKPLIISPFTYLSDTLLPCFHRWNHGLKILFGKRILVWIYIAVKGFYTSMTQIKFIHYRLLHHELGIF